MPLTAGAERMRRTSAHTGVHIGVVSGQELSQHCKLTTPIEGES
jgi:hypothetical protein